MKMEGLPWTDLSVICKYLDKPTTEKMIKSVVTSRLDYCNSLLYGINGYLVPELQRCQNSACGGNMTI